MGVTGVTKALAEFIVNAKFEDFPESSVNYTKDLGLSFLGAVLWGSTLDGSQVAIRLVRQMGGTPEAGVVGAGFKVPVAHAAFANGYSEHEAEIEGNSWPESANSMTLWPVVLSLGEKFRMSGKDIIEGFIVGQEVQSRIGRGCHRGLLARGFFPLATWGTFGAAAGAAKLLKLDAGQTRAALSIAASSTSGLFRQVGTMVHYLESAMSCRDGLIAAMLAKDGHTADQDMLDDIPDSWNGFCTACAGEVDIDAILKGLGKPPFRVEEMGSKYFPCCDFQQRLLYGTSELVKKHAIKYEDVEGVMVEGNTTLGRHLHYSEPKDYEETRFSIQHGIAGALIEKEVGPFSFSDQSAVDPRFIETRRKVKVIIHPEWDPAMQSGYDMVTIKLKNGNKYEAKCTMGGGNQQHLSHERALTKYRLYASKVLTSEQMEEPKKLMLELEKLDDVSKLMKLLTFVRNG